MTSSSINTTINLERKKKGRNIDLRLLNVCDELSTLWFDAVIDNNVCCVDVQNQVKKISKKKKKVGQIEQENSKIPIKNIVNHKYNWF